MFYSLCLNLKKYMMCLFSDGISKLQTRQRKVGVSMQLRNEKDVLKIIEAIKNEWCNPFNLNEVPNSLVNICSGKQVNEEVEKNFTTFIHEVQNLTGLKYDTSKPSEFWKPQKRNKIKTFTDSHIRDKKKGNILIGSELMFRRILCAAQLREINLGEILSHELTLVPLSMFHEDGSMRKTNKSDLAKKIVEPSNTPVKVPLVQSLIIDAMATIQAMNEKQYETFNDFGKVFLTKILNFARECQASRITIVFDTYKIPSIKAAERIRRGESGLTQFNIIGTRKVGVFRDLLKSVRNKRSLLIFLTEYLTLNSFKDLLDGEALIIAGGFENNEKVVLIKKYNPEQHLEDLYSNQEEADTRIILHTVYESQYSQRILIKSIDTDVLLLLIHFYCSLSTLEAVELLIELGHGAKRRYVPINMVVETLGKELCSCFLSIHCLTGCDTTSAFYKVGKKTAFDILKKNLPILKDFKILPLLSEDKALELATKYVLLIYRNKDKNITTLNELRMSMATTTNKPSSELPPTNAAFYQHFLR